MKLKKFMAMLLIAVMACCLATACGSSDSGEEATDETAVEKTDVKIGVRSDLIDYYNAIEPVLQAKGYNPEMVSFDDSIQPNVALAEGSIDINWFQHEPYLTAYNAENGTDLVAVGNVHYEAMGAYKGQKDSFDALADGDKIGVPNDVTNEARALQLLAANGVITLKDGVGLEATKLDIVDNPKNIEIVELEAATIPASLPDLALGVINANYALGAGLTTDDAVAYEAADSEAAETYVNVIVVNAGNENSEKTQALVKAIQTDAVKDFILEKYNGAVQPKF